MDANHSEDEKILRNKEKMQILRLVTAALLLICLWHMPYGAYTLIRFVLMIAFALFAYEYCKKKKDLLMVVFGALVLLFQPFFKIALGRELWCGIDLVVAILMIVLWYKERRQPIPPTNS